MSRSGRAMGRVFSCGLELDFDRALEEWPADLDRLTSAFL